MSTLLICWERLHHVKTLAFHAKSKSKENLGWGGKGTGEVIVTKESDPVLIFHEKGTWVNKQGNQIDFNNVFRWTLDSCAGVISLEHLRRGANHPVFLFHLAPSSQQSLSSLTPHLCKRDAYFGHLHFNLNSFHLTWRIIGPKKNEEIDYDYF